MFEKLLRLPELELRRAAAVRAPQGLKNGRTDTHFLVIGKAGNP